MADITMCVGTGCPLRETCYRYMAEPNEYRQSFADFTGKVTQGEDGFGTPAPDCTEYVPNAEITGRTLSQNEADAA